MNIIDTTVGNWHVECLPGDGGRISVLQYAGKDLLTSLPTAFKSPGENFGEYESRPVYGYDDCFPTVDRCRFPDQQYMVRDHGELCWMEWQIRPEGRQLICTVDCPHPPATFIRTLEFEGNILKWKFTILNRSASGFSFLHVMHALMPLQLIRKIELPDFDMILDENTFSQPGLKKPNEVVSFLMNLNSGTFTMLLLRNPKTGLIRLGLKNGLTLVIDFPVNNFPTIGIWWNKAGYPGGNGQYRTECAFEPIPGSCSSLEKSFREGIYLTAEPGKNIHYEIIWKIEQN